MILHLRLTLAKSLRYFIIKQIALYKARIFLMLHNQYSKYLKMKNIVKVMLLIAITLALLSQVIYQINADFSSLQSTIMLSVTIL